MQATLYQFQVNPQYLILYILIIFIYYFLILSQQDPVDNRTLYWRVILDKYLIIIIIIIIIIVILLLLFLLLLYYQTTVDFLVEMNKVFSKMWIFRQQNIATFSQVEKWLLVNMLQSKAHLENKKAWNTKNIKGLKKRHTLYRYTCIWYLLS